MHSYTLSHLRDDVLLRDLARLVAQDRLTTALLLAHIAEVDSRRLYVPAGYSSMHAYCVEELRLSECAAAKRIHAARAARRHPSLFRALAEGRLHLAGICLLAPHLTMENAQELIETATHRRKSEIEELLARRFGRPEPPGLIRPLTPIRPMTRARIPQQPPGAVGVDPSAVAGTVESVLPFEEHALGAVEREVSASVGTSGAAGASAATGAAGVPAAAVPLDQQPPGAVEDSRQGPEPQSQSQSQSPPQPALPERYLLRLPISKSTHDRLRYAQALLSHALPNGDLAQLLDRALDALIPQLERQKFAAITRRPSRERRVASLQKRHVPAHVRRSVWERDQGQCTFVSSNGTRCKARRFLEFDHADPVARGGEATVERMRLRCRAHNQHEAERTFGAEFVARKRQEARLAAAERRAIAAMKAESEAQGAAP